jgi:hypothetical protein
VCECPPVCVCVCVYVCVCVCVCVCVYMCECARACATVLLSYNYDLYKDTWPNMICTLEEVWYVICTLEELWYVQGHLKNYDLYTWRFMNCTLEELWSVIWRIMICTRTLDQSWSVHLRNYDLYKNTSFRIHLRGSPHLNMAFCRVRTHAHKRTHRHAHTHTHIHTHALTHTHIHSTHLLNPCTHGSSWVSGVWRPLWS